MQYIPADNTASLLLIDALGNLGSGLGKRAGYNEALKKLKQDTADQGRDVQSFLDYINQSNAYPQNLAQAQYDRENQQAMNSAFLPNPFRPGVAPMFPPQSLTPLPKEPVMPQFKTPFGAQLAGQYALQGVKNPTSSDELLAKLVQDKVSGKGTQQTDEAIKLLSRRNQYQQALKLAMYQTEDGEFRWGYHDPVTGGLVEDLRKANPKEITSSSIELLDLNKAAKQAEVEKKEAEVEMIPLEKQKKQLEVESLSLHNEFQKETDPVKKEIIGQQLEEKKVRIEQIKAQTERTQKLIEKMEGSDQYKADIAKGIEAFDMNEDPHNIARQVSSKYPEKSAEINRIFLSEEPRTAIEAMIRQGMKENTPPRPKTFEVEKEKLLDPGTAQKILDEAGGDREKARVIAKERGYKL